MNKADLLLKYVTSGKPDVDQLISYGINIGLPAEVNIVDTEGAVLEQYSIGGVLGQVAVPKFTKLKETPQGWEFSNGVWPNVVANVGDWWPALVHVRLEALIEEIPETYKGLDLTEPLALTRHLDWDRAALLDFHGGSESRSMELAMLSVIHNRDAHLHIYPGNIWPLAVSLLPASSTDHRTIKIRDKRWIPFFEGFIQRLESLDVTIPTA